MSESKRYILGRLRSKRMQSTTAPEVYQKALDWDHERRIDAFTRCMRAVRGEVHRLARDQWVDWINRELPERGLRRLLIGSGPIADQYAAGAADGIELRRYDRKVDDWKEALFHEVDVALTGTLAGLAESGSLVLWPDAREPRLMSLAPPAHLAILEADRLFDNFAQLIAAEDWATRMPTNALLISGPSKTADIEQTLAYGIHGPKTLITLIIE